MAEGSNRAQALVDSWADLPSLSSQDDFVFVPDQGLKDDENPREDWEIKEEAVKKNATVILMSVKCFETLGAIQPLDVIENAVGKFLRKRADETRTEDGKPLFEVEDGKVHSQAVAVRALAQEVVRQAKKTMQVRKGRTWLAPLKEACGPHLLAKKFKRKSQGHAHGSEADKAETQPMPEFAGQEPSPRPGDIPDPKCPPLHVLDKVVRQLDKTPPQAFDPKLQHKKQFRAHVKGQAAEGEESNEAQQADAANAPGQAAEMGAAQQQQMAEVDANRPGQPAEMGAAQQQQMAEVDAKRPGQSAEMGAAQQQQMAEVDANRPGQPAEADANPPGQMAEEAAAPSGSAKAGQADMEGGKDTQDEEQPVPDEGHEAKKFVYKPGILQSAFAKFVTHAKELGVNHKDALALWKTSRVRMAILEDVDDKERKKRRFG